MKRKYRLKIKITENDVKKQVKDYLDIMGWFNFPLTAGMGSYKGVPDRIAIKDGRVLFIEIKRPGGKQNTGQIEFERNINYKEGEYLLIDNLDKLIEAIERR